MMTNWEFESELALRAVSAAEEVIKEKGERTVVAVKDSLRDVVSETDKRVETRIKEILKVAGHSIIAEESFSNNSDLSLLNGKCWVVDPLDGTANFVTGLPFYAISVGYVERGEFEVGAISIPSQKELFFTFGDQGSYLNGRPLTITDSDLKRSLVAASFSGSRGDESLRNRQYELFGVINDSSRGCLRLGSAATNLCYVAAGRLQACYGFDAFVWDVAGGIAVAKRAGCHAVELRQPNSPKLSYVVGSKPVVNQLIELFRSKGGLGF